MRFKWQQPRWRRHCRAYLIPPLFCTLVMPPVWCNHLEEDERDEKNESNPRPTKWRQEEEETSSSRQIASHFWDHAFCLHKIFGCRRRLFGAASFASSDRHQGHHRRRRREYVHQPEKVANRISRCDSSPHSKYLWDGFVHGEIRTKFSSLNLSRVRNEMNGRLWPHPFPTTKLFETTTTRQKIDEFSESTSGAAVGLRKSQISSSPQVQEVRWGY